MSNIIQVRIASKAARTLFVEDQGGYQVRSAQTIIWQLVNNAATGRFTGFRWITQDPKPEQPEGPFGPPVFGAHRVSVQDDLSVLGEWIYQLTAEVDGELYSTTFSLDRNVGVDNPNIINR